MMPERFPRFRFNWIRRNVPRQSGKKLHVAAQPRASSWRVFRANPFVNGYYRWPTLANTQLTIRPLGMSRRYPHRHGELDLSTTMKESKWKKTKTKRKAPQMRIVQWMKSSILLLTVGTSQPLPGFTFRTWSCCSSFLPSRDSSWLKSTASSKVDACRFKLSR